MTTYPKPNCCIRNINIDYNMKYSASYTARSNYGDPDKQGDLNNGNTSVDTSIESKGPEIDVNKEVEGDENPGLPQDVKDAATKDFQENPDRWFKDDTYDDSNQGPEQETNKHGEENWDEISENSQNLTSGGDYTHGPENPYKHDFELPLRRMSRPAEFCGDKFIRWLDSNGPRL